jgi:hypothetical protein
MADGRDNAEVSEAAAKQRDAEDELVFDKHDVERVICEPFSREMHKQLEDILINHFLPAIQSFAVEQEEIQSYQDPAVAQIASQALALKMDDAIELMLVKAAEIGMPEDVVIQMLNEYQKYLTRESHPKVHQIVAEDGPVPESVMQHRDLVSLLVFIKENVGIALGQMNHSFIKRNKVVLLFGDPLQVDFEIIDASEQSDATHTDQALIEGTKTELLYDHVLQFLVFLRKGDKVLVIGRDAMMPIESDGCITIDLSKPLQENGRHSYSFLSMDVLSAHFV